MDATDFSVLQSCQRWLDACHDVVLITVVRTWGSSPRPPGSMMAIRADGTVVGSVSGGCIEDDLVDEMRRLGSVSMAPTGRPAVRTYGVLAEEARQFGLPCGGTLRVVLEPLSGSSRIGELARLLQLRKAIRRTLDMHSGAVRLEAAGGAHELEFNDAGLSYSLGPRYRLIVIGAGQLSRYLCQMAIGLNFDVTVCDPREEYRDDWQIEGITMSYDMPDDLVLGVGPDAHTAIVALTHDPKLDDLALMHALQSPAFYVGALGSRSNHAKRVARLKEHFGLTEGELDQLRGPIGLYLGSKTPPEIAISILAELIAAKNNIAIPSEMRTGPAKLIADR